MPLATLPMYDFPHVRPATEALWSAIRDALRRREVNAPERLTPSSDVWRMWQDPAMLFGQTCGAPYVSTLRGRVSLIGTPDYDCVPGRPGWYASVVICRADDPRKRLADFADATFAYNELGSQSGCHAMMHTVLHKVGDGRLFRRCVATGAHARSAVAVAEGRADIAAIDAVTWRFVKDQPALAGLRSLMQSDPTPGLPYITAFPDLAEALADATEEGIASLPAKTRAALSLKGLWRSSDADYDLIAHRIAETRPVFEAHFGDVTA